MANLMNANKQWANRPMDERYTNLIDMQQHFHDVKRLSRQGVVSSRKLKAIPTGTDTIHIAGPAGVGYEPTHWAFGQIANQIGAPAGYLRKLPAPLVADQLNYMFQYDADIQDVGIYVQDNGVDKTFKAMTGPRYGRIFNAQVLDALVQHFGDGTSGDFRVPGIFGQKLEQVTKQNTTLFASDRDMFVFLADEEHRIELPNRRNGEPGSLARGFFVWNSEVGAQTWGMAGFLFDYVCANRIVWGAEEYREVKLRHTVSAPDKFLAEIKPALDRYANSSTASVTTAIEDARNHRLDDVEGFLASRFGTKAMKELDAIHLHEEGRPIETRWDVITAVTAKARDIPYQDQRIDLERQAGDLLNT